MAQKDRTMAIKIILSSAGPRYQRRRAGLRSLGPVRGRAHRRGDRSRGGRGRPAAIRRGWRGSDLGSDRGAARDAPPLALRRRLGRLLRPRRTVGDDASGGRGCGVRPCGCSDMGRHRAACPEHGRLDYRQRDVAVHRRRVAERRSAGLCISCPADDVRRADPGVLRCSRCRLRATEAQRGRAETQRGRVQEGWIILDESTPLRALREMAGLSLAEAARRAGLRGPTSVQGLERIEGSPEGGSTTVGTLRKRAEAWGFEVRIQVRRVSLTKPREQGG
jgi:ribosomal protein L37AE/L43A